eukprot:2421558-Lingulodinium_polyedra.AAC.1
MDWKITANWQQEKAILQDPDGINSKLIYNIFVKEKKVLPQYPDSRRQEMLKNLGQDLSGDEEEAPAG